MTSTTKAAFSPDSIYQLKVTLKDSEPPIWRRIQVPGKVNLLKLHEALQVAMGWTDSHLHQFIIQGQHFSIPSEDDLEPVIDEHLYQLWKVAPREGMKFIYEYDFGDGWTHLVEVEKILPHDSNFKHPVCLEGERACPPEDVGGTGGYDLFLEAIADPEHEEHESYVEWIEPDFDPEVFDLAEVNLMLLDVKTR